GRAGATAAAWPHTRKASATLPSSSDLRGPLYCRSNGDANTSQRLAVSSRLAGAKSARPAAAESGTCSASAIEVRVAMNNRCARTSDLGVERPKTGRCARSDGDASGGLESPPSAAQNIFAAPVDFLRPPRHGSEPGRRGIPKDTKEAPCTTSSSSTATN